VISEREPLRIRFLSREGYALTNSGGDPSKRGGDGREGRISQLSDRSLHKRTHGQTECYYPSRCVLSLITKHAGPCRSSDVGRLFRFGGAGHSSRKIRMDETIESKRCQFFKAKLALVYRQLVLLNPNDADAHVHLGDICFEIGKYEDAIAAYKKVIRLKPNDSLAHYNLAKAYLKIGNKAMAIEEYNLLKTLDVELDKELSDIILRQSAQEKMGFKTRCENLKNRLKVLQHIRHP
jgi:hypothetical protein